MNEYACIRCGREFLREKKLRADAKVICDPCREEARKASKRATWQMHKDKYRPGGKPVHKPVHKEEPVPVSEPTGGLVDWWLPSGGRVVWMGPLRANTR